MGHERTWVIYSDTPTGIDDAVWIPSVHYRWPGPTLHRHRTLLLAAEQLETFDYVFQVDADMLFGGPVGDEIFGRLVAVLHPGFAGKPRTSFTYETRATSSARVLPSEGEHYFCGAFQGGAPAEYLAACRTMQARIEEDTERGIVPVWWDESHWNRYLIDRPPDLVLSPLYCSPDSWNVPGRKLIALDKNHAEMRA